MIPVMIVDDELIVRIGIRSIVEWEKLGFQIVAEASDGMDALDKFRVHKPRLMFIDINMPLMNGIDLMKEIRKQDKDVYFVVLSAYDNFSFAQQAIKVNAVEYILKASMLREDLEELLKRLYLSISEAYGNKSLSVADEKDIICDMENPNVNQDQLEVLFRKSLPGEVHKNIWYFRVKGVIPESNQKIIFRTLESLVENVFKSNNIKSVVLKGNKYLIAISESITSNNLAGLVDNLFAAFENYIQHRIMLGVSLNMKENLDIYKYLNMARTASYNLVLQPDKKYMVYSENFSKSNVEDEKRLLVLTGVIRKDFSFYSFDSILERLEELFAFLRRSSSYNILCKAVLQLSSITSEYLNESDNILPDSILGMDDINLIQKEFTEKFKIIINGIRADEKNYDLYVAEAKKYVEENFNKELTLTNISKILHLSPNYLGKIFYKNVGKRITYYITEVRIFKACELMKNRNHSMQQVAEMVGINNQQYFSKIFKTVKGLSPKDYRKRTNY